MIPNNDSNPDAQNQQQEKVTDKTRLGTRLAIVGVLVFQFVLSIRGVLKKPSRKLAASADAPPSPEVPVPLAAYAHAVVQPEAVAVVAIPAQTPDRSFDRNLDAEAAVNSERGEFWGMLLALFAAVVAFTGCIGFLTAYWSNTGNLLLGGSLAVGFAGLGAMLVVWGRMLTVQREAVSPREPLRPPEPEREAAAEAFTLGAHDIRRRCMLRWIGYSFAGMFVVMATSLLRSLGLPSYTALNSPIWKRGQRLMTAEGKPVSVDLIQPGNTLTVFPEDSIGDERSQTVLIRVDQALLELPHDRENWAPNGILAYSRVCTHAGCTVGLYEKTNYLLLCPCHQSTFDVLRAARPNGGPAARALPQLPIYADSDGTLRAGGGFSEPPGPGFWGMS